MTKNDVSLYFIKLKKNDLLNVDKFLKEIAFFKKENFLVTNNKKDLKCVQKIASELFKIFFIKKYVKNLNSWNIFKKDNGKPFVLNSKFHFNISHSWKMIALAVSKNEVGLDLQKQQNISLLTQQKFHLIHDTFSPIELWTIKESGYKLFGNFKIFRNQLFFNNNEYYEIDNQKYYFLNNTISKKYYYTVSLGKKINNCRSQVYESLNDFFEQEIN